MQKFYQPIFTCLFFALVIIASCITFRDKSNFDNYTFDGEMYAQDIDLFDGFKIYKAPNKIHDKKQLLLLFNKDSLKYIITNNLWYSIRYKYALIEDSLHTLYKDKFKRMERGGGYTVTDSIIVCKNIIIKKKSLAGNRIMHWNNNNIDVYVKNNAVMVHYNFTNKSNQRNYTIPNAKAIIQLFQQAKLVVNDSIAFIVKDTTTLTKETEKQFFRKAFF
jgi:hypothetical protein